MFNDQQSLKRLTLILAGLLALSGMLAACQPPPPPVENAPVTDQTTAATYGGKRVFYVDSYHIGYEWSDGIEAGFRQALDGTGIMIEAFHLDTKRNTSPEFCEQAGVEAAAALEAFNPDVVVATDDNAQKCVVVPFLKDKAIPVIYLGVNWDASSYNYSTDQITGMVEIDLVPSMLSHLREYAKGEKVGYVTVASETEDKVISVYNEQFLDGTMQSYTVKTYEEFKAAFLQAQTETDMVIIGNNAGIDVWNEAEAEQFFLENTHIPTATIYDWLAPYVLLTMAKVAEEQGEWGAQTTLRILDGTPVADIPYVSNKKGNLILNLDLAAQMNVVFAPAILRNADVYPAQTAGS